MAAGDDARAAGERIEALLAELGANAGPQVAATAEELVSCLVELYGAGLAQIVRICGEDAEGDGSGRRLLTRLAADPLVESLLLVHDLHPVDPGTRIQRAIGRVMPGLGPHAGQVEYRGIDDQGVVHLRLERSAHGCGSPATAVLQALESAVLEAAPETAGVDVDVVSAPKELPLLQITRHPAAVRGAR
jgi:Fe-S cluster biogenesis protein NfuA